MESSARENQDHAAAHRQVRMVRLRLLVVGYGVISAFLLAWGERRRMEVAAGFEPANNGFATPGRTGPEERTEG